MKKQELTRILLALVCCILSMAITLQVRTMSKQDSNVSQIFRNDELKDSLLEWEEKYSSMTEELQNSSKELEKIRTSTTQTDSSQKDKSDNLAKNNMLLGLIDVEGEGITITAKDGQVAKAADNLSDFLVHDVDLREIVSELSNAGAEAISINDQRIVNTTCIVCAGNVISINGEKVTSPFVIKAIGNQERLFGINRPGGYLQYMKEYTSVDIKKASNVKIKKYNGALNFKYAIIDDK